ncbi:hypothetical protein DDB_G0288399 [Dictyostelium discoideum AX4]|uniref:Uncharacterized protein n=1 Tax=Dictyostelium discoideum TaxID=44689 RepID=Q54J01_DICDI|nr:hypothetical protein DDB_G0288399 [Dictyostelium discoideum AX4]EAL63225.1 hypothetical protein DDB_G0288399 [Dictyostelium discoideum AX4]|eukprot:XP_636729.1 hypothetical protein DDB_G0288399 [Dictyostelium discoideum AX4]
MGNTQSNLSEWNMDSNKFQPPKEPLNPKIVNKSKVDRNLNDRLYQKPDEGLVWPHNDNFRELYPEFDEHYLLG